MCAAHRLSTGPLAPALVPRVQGVVWRAEPRPDGTYSVGWPAPVAGFSAEPAGGCSNGTPPKRHRSPQHNVDLGRLQVRPSHEAHGPWRVVYANRAANLDASVLRLLSTRPLLGPLPPTGAELVAYWQREGVIGTRPDIMDSQAHPRQRRHTAERRRRE
jgi:hypothetical protein